MEHRTHAALVVMRQLDCLQVGDGLAYDRMTLFPVFSLAHPAEPLRYVTLEEALASGQVEITEREHATVPEVTLRNRGTTMVLILDGEEIIGGLQNRVVNTTFLVAARSTIRLPVTCVEAGRWHGTTRAFAAGDASYFSLRRAKHVQVQANLRVAAMPLPDQGAVWQHLAERQASARVNTPTGAMHDLYRVQAGRLGDYEEAFPYVPGAVGFLVALSGHIAGADLFDQPRTAEALWPKLVRSYALDTMEGGRGRPVSQERAVHLLERARNARCEVYPSPALGQDVRLAGRGVVGGGLVYRDTAVHINLFGMQGERPARGSGISRPSIRRRLHQRPWLDCS